MRGKHCQIDTLLSKAVIEKMYMQTIFVAVIFKIAYISGFSKTPFLTHLYNFDSKMNCLVFKKKKKKSLKLSLNFQQVNKYFIDKNSLNQRLVFN